VIAFNEGRAIIVTVSPCEHNRLHAQSRWPMAASLRTSDPQKSDQSDPQQGRPRAWSV